MANDVLFKYGTRAEYNALSAENVKDNALYFLTDTGELLRGSRNMGQANHYEGTREGTETDMEVIARVVADANLIKNDIFVVKTLIAEDKYSFTAYTYDGANWCAMDGNYNAENVYFDQDLTATENVGTIVIPSAGFTTVETKGKSLEQVLQEILAKEKEPVVTQPSVSITLDQYKYEVGTILSTMMPNVITSKGSYSYDDDTGVEMVEQYGTVTSTDGQTGYAYPGKFGDPSVIWGGPQLFADLQITENTNWNETISINYTDGIVPHTNLGNECPDKQIKAGTITASLPQNVTGYWPVYYGVLPVDDQGFPNQTSDNVRAMTKFGEYKSGAKITIKAADYTNPKCFAIAFPGDPNSPYNVKSAILTSTMNLDITSEYDHLENGIGYITGGKSTLCMVKGENNYTATTYHIIWYAPAQIGADEVHEITFA